MTKLFRLQLLFCLILLLFQNEGIAQRFYWAEPDADSHTFIHSIRAIEVDSEDNIVAFGIIGDRYISENLDIRLDSSYNYFIAKFDSEGEVIWLEAIASSGYLNPSDNQIGLALDAEDNIYVAATIRYNERLNFQGQVVEYGGAGSGSDTDVFLAKYDSDAELQFVVNQSADDSYANALTVDNSGNIYLAGTFSGDIVFDELHTSSGGDDAYLVMYDQFGVPQWSLIRGNSIGDDSFDLKSDGTNIYWGTNIKTGSSPAQYHTVIEKLNASGTSIWSYTISGSDSGYYLNGSAIHSDDGSIYITGDFRNSIDFPTAAAPYQLSTSPSNFQAFVSKLTDNGTSSTFNWAVERGSTIGSDFAFDIKKTLGRVYLLKRNSFDFQIERLSDVDGEFEDSLTPDHPTTSYSYGYSLAIASDNSIYIGGYNNGPFRFASEVKASSGMLLAKTLATFSTVEWVKGPLQHKKEFIANAHDDAGNMYVGGIMSGDYKDEIDIFYGLGNNEGYVQKYSPTGELLFTRMHTSLFEDKIVEIKVSGDHLYVVGTFDADDGTGVLQLDESTSVTGDEYEEVYLAKYDLDGNLIWAINAASTEGDITVSDMAIDPEGNIYLHGDALGGSPKNFGNGFTFSFDDQGSFIAKYDENGLTQWVNIIDGTESDAIDLLGEQVIIGGTFDDDIDFGGTPLIIDGSNDIYLASYSLDGVFNWVKEVGGDSWENITTIRSNADDSSIYLSGYFYNEFSIESEDLIGVNREGFIAKYNANGSFDWVSGGGGPRNDYFYSLGIDTIGNPYVIGKYEGSATFGSLSFNGLGDRDIQAILIGYDKITGDEIFSAEYGYPTNYIEGDDDDYFNSISIDQNNDFYLTGDFIDEVALDTILLPDDGNNSFFSAKMSLSDCAYVGEVNFEYSGSLCGNEALTFTDLTDLGGHEISSWSWSFGDGNISDVQNPEYTYNEEGDYLVTLTVGYFGGACELSLTKFLAIESANEVSAGEDIEICYNEIISVTGTRSGSTTETLWNTSGDGLFENVNALSTDYTPGPNDLNTGSVDLIILSVGGGCITARDTVTATIRDEVVVDAGTDQIVCYGESASLDGMFTGTSSILWTSLGDGTFDNPTSGLTTYNPGAEDLINQEVELVLSSNSGECELARDTILIRMEDEIVADAGADQTICAGERVNIAAIVSGTLTLLWSTSGDGEFADVNANETVYIPGLADVESGFVELFLVTAGNDCEESDDSILVLINPIKEADDYSINLLGTQASQLILSEDELEMGFALEIVSQPANGVAEINEGTIIYSLIDPSVSSDDFIYSVQTVCGNSEGQILITNELGSVEVYNVVTPNNDGHHDYLKIKNIASYPENTVSVFDRSGKVVFSTVGYNSTNAFRGISDSGKELPEGNYFYRLQIPTLELDQSGFILLKR